MYGILGTAASLIEAPSAATESTVSHPYPDVMPSNKRCREHESLYLLLLASKHICLREVSFTVFCGVDGQAKGVQWGGTFADK